MTISKKMTLTTGRRTKIRFGFFTGFAGLTLLIGLCSCTQADEDYRAGIYWLNRENNWEMAVRSFRRSLARAPKRWKTHKMLIIALARGNKPDELEAQLKETFTTFPDKDHSEIAQAAIANLGEERYYRIASAYQVKRLGEKLATKGDELTLLSKAIMASSRLKDTLAVLSYFDRLLETTDGKNLPDSVIQEMNFAIGSAHVEWLIQERRVKKDPHSIPARIAQLNAGLLKGDSAAVMGKLAELAALDDHSSIDQDFACRFGHFAGVKAFETRVIESGSDGCYAPDGETVVLVRNMGTEREPDPYFYQTARNGDRVKPLLKAVQHFLLSIAMPSFSPDGDWLYFYGSAERDWNPGRQGRFELYRMKPRWGQKPQKLTSENLLPVNPHFEESGSVLIVRRDIGSVRSSIEVIRLHPRSGKVESVSRIGEPVSGAAFTPDGDSLLLATDRGLFRRSVNGGNIAVDIPWMNTSFPKISPDGRKLLYSNRYSHMILLDRGSGKSCFLGSAALPWGSFGTGGRALITRMVDGKPTVVELNLESPVADVSAFIRKLKSGESS